MGATALGAPRAANPSAGPRKIGGGFESPLPPPLLHGFTLAGRRLGSLAF